MVGATGTNLRYQWQAKGSGSWFDLEDNDAYSGTTTAHLQFRPNETFEDGGENWESVGFRCVVNGNGAADEENCTVFKEGGKYYCRIRLTPAEGYYFPTEKTTINYRPAYLYTGKVSVNGEPYNDKIYCNADGTSIVIDWWEDAAQPELRQHEITVTYADESVSVAKDGSLILTAFHNTHPEAKTSNSNGMKPVCRSSGEPLSAAQRIAVLSYRRRPWE